MFVLNKFFKSILIIVILIITACTNKNEIWKLDSKIHKHHVELILQARDEVYEKTGHWVDIVSDYGDNIITTPDIIDKISPTTGKKTFIGLYVHNEKNGDKILIKRTLSDDKFYSTVLHELSHYLGCWDHIHEGNVMHTCSDSLHLTQEDIDCINGIDDVK